jgi:sugar fermentation stimulation protein A
MNTCTPICRSLETTALPRGGTYLVLLWLHAARSLVIGRLGQQRFPRGYYIYTGSAKSSLRARLHRHLHGASTRHWHLDYLRPALRVVGWCAFAGETQPECTLLQQLLPWGEVVMPKFGASDCSCTTHLLYYPRRSRVTAALQHVVGRCCASYNVNHYGGRRKA